MDDVKAIVDTDMTDSQIEGLIDECGAMINAKIGSSADPLILRAINRTWAAYRVMMKDPESQGLGEYRHDRSTSLKLMRDDYLIWLKIGGGGIAMQMGHEPLPRW